MVASLLGRWSERAEIVEVYRMTIARGRRQSRPHAAGVTESLTVINGTVRAGGQGAPADLSSGQAHTFRGDQDHVYEGIAPLSSTVLVMRYPQPLTPPRGADSRSR